MFLEIDAIYGNTADVRHFQSPLKKISSRWSGDVQDLAPGCHVKSLRAESKVVLVHNQGYILRLLLRQERGKDQNPDFPLG